MIANRPREQVALSTAVLAAAGIEEASLDAELLLADLLGLSRTMLRLADPELTPEQLAAYHQRIAQRVARIPLPHIIGWQEFYGLRLAVDSRVLIPRWDSEPLCEALAEELAGRGPVRIADLGTGSGALAAAMAHLLPEAEVWAVDDDPAALAMAERNFAALGLTDRIHHRLGDLDAPLPAAGFEGVISNPPYIPSAVIDTLEPEVRLHDPRHALDGGEDGLDVIRAVIPACGRLLVPDGVAVIECADDQAARVTALVQEAHGLEPVRVVHDLGGRERGVMIRRTA